jgi:hypothetical protein
MAADMNNHHPMPINIISNPIIVAYMVYAPNLGTFEQNSIVGIPKINAEIPGTMMTKMGMIEIIVTSAYPAKYIAEKIPIVMRSFSSSFFDSSMAVLFLSC